MAAATDIVLAFCLAAVAVVVVAILADIQGGALPVGDWFTWHPILMTLAFPCLMVLGRWAYVTDSIDAKSTRRSVHRAFMLSGSVVAAAGYLCIFMAHYPSRKFLGYDFIGHQWAIPARVAHAWLGYLVLLLVLAQVPIGLAKLEFLQRGHRIFSAHGLIGYGIISLSAVNMCIAAYFWSWRWPVKIAVAALSLLAARYGVWPQAAQSDEKLPLATA